MDALKPGLAEELSFIVEEQYTATHVGSGALSVLATPSMIGFMERVSHRCLAKHLPEDLSSVGILVNVRHLAPTPAGFTVRVRCEILDVEGKRITFLVQAWDAKELVGEGEHQRMIIDRERFLKRVREKKRDSE